MRNIFFFMAICIMSVSASTYAQKTRLSLNIQNGTIYDVVSEIEKQTDFMFFYKSGDIDSNLKVSIHADNRTVPDILNDIMKSTDLTYIVDNKHILLARKSNPVFQQINVTGSVTDELGEPMPGVNIVVKGTTTGVVTNISGEFSISVPNTDAVLVFSFIGYMPQEVIVGNQTRMQVRMAEDALQIEEIIVVGYGTMKKSDLTGTVVRADINAFSESPNVSIIQSLQGSVAGLNVGQVKNAGEDPDISVRGRTTMSGTTGPLIVLDGIIFRGSMVDINPHDIQSIDILKDASATAIYGSQASNGVLIITTKSGTDLGKPVISYSGTVSWQFPTNKDLFPSDAQGFLDKIAATYIGESRLGPDYLTPNPAWNPATHLMDKNAVDGYNKNVNTDWWGMLTQDYGFIHDHNLGVRGKNKTTGYYFSIGYTDQQNIMVNDQYSRYSIRINLDNKITDWFKVGVQTFLTVSNKPGYIPTSDDKPTLSELQYLPPIVAAYDDKGNPVVYPYKTSINPLFWKEIDQKDNRMNLFGNFYADVDIPFIKGLNYRLNFGQNLQNTRKYVFNQWDSNLEGKGSKKYGNQYDWTVDNIVTYKRQFGDHNINATFVYGIEERKYDNTTSEASKFVNPALGYNYLQGGQADLQSASSGGWDESSVYSMLRLFYSFKSRYMFTGTIRRDGFSGFGTNNKFAYFPSGALAWVASEESFIRDNVSWLNNLKLRLSYGSNGNRTLKRYQTLAQAKADHKYLYGDGGSPAAAQYISTLANSDLKWEKSSTFNFGLDFSVLKSRLYGSFDFYAGKTTDMLYDIDIPYANGVDPAKVSVNLGEMTNRGQEFTLTGIPIDRDGFQWTVSFNFSRNRNKIISILGRDDNGDGKEDDLLAGGRSNSIMIDEPYGIWYDYNIIGMWQIADGSNIPAGFDFGTYKVEDIDGDGKYTADKDRKLIGYKDPSYRFSIQNSFFYKGLELKIFINSVQGGNKYYMGESGPYGTWSNTDNVYQNNSPVWDWWMPENPGAKYRRLGAFPQSLGYDVHPYTSRSFVRLQDVTLSYTFAPKILDKIGLKMLKVYVSGKNLATWTNWDGWDPETGQGIEPGGFPVMKSYSLGLNVEF